MASGRPSDWWSRGPDRTGRRKSGRRRRGGGEAEEMGTPHMHTSHAHTHHTHTHTHAHIAHTHITHARTHHTCTRTRNTARQQNFGGKQLGETTGGPGRGRCVTTLSEQNSCKNFLSVRVLMLCLRSTVVTLRAREGVRYDRKRTTALAGKGSQNICISEPRDTAAAACDGAEPAPSTFALHSGHVVFSLSHSLRHPWQKM
jgi:hypothetical protein